MSILFGHPTGNPNSHQAAFAHYEANRLEAFCVPWMPSPRTLQLVERIGPLRSLIGRFGRRCFSPLHGAPKIQGRLGEMGRLVTRALGCGDEALAYEANDWLMGTMARECKRVAVTAVHAYEDCSLQQFTEAKRLGKACIYDMPIGYYAAWEHRQSELAREFVDWLPSGGLPSSRYVRPQQKRQEMELADLVLVPSSFVAKTIRQYYPDKPLGLAPYGVDLDFWSPGARKGTRDELRFIYAGQVSLRKGMPILLEAWQKAGLRSAKLQLVGSWHLSNGKRAKLPNGVEYASARSRELLRDEYHSSDIFVFPSYFEGFGLVLLEAMACGLPAIASDATAGPDVLTEECGRVLPVGDVDALVAAFRWFDQNRDRLPEMGRAARRRAEQCTWEGYRRSVTEVIAAFV